MMRGWCFCQDLASITWQGFVWRELDHRKDAEHGPQGRDYQINYLSWASPSLLWAPPDIAASRGAPSFSHPHQRLPAFLPILSHLHYTPPVNTFSTCFLYALLYSFHPLTQLSKKNTIQRLNFRPKPSMRVVSKIKRSSQSDLIRPVRIIKNWSKTI